MLGNAIRAKIQRIRNLPNTVLAPASAEPPASLPTAVSDPGQTPEEPLLARLRETRQ